MTAVSGFVWAGIVALAAPATWDAWGWLIRDAIASPPAVPHLSDLAGAFARHSATFAAVAVLTACSYLGGLRPASLLRGGCAGRAEYGFLALGFGWAAIAFVLLGLALTGLFFPPLVLAAAAGVGVAGLAAVRDAPSAGFRRPGRGTVLTFVAAGAPGLLLMFANSLPDNFYDTCANHMSAPEHVLGMHRLVTSHQHTTINSQLHSELMNVLGIVLGRDELAHWISLIPFAAGLGVAAAWLGRLAGPRPAALALGLSLDLGGLWWVMLRGKNDTAVAGFVIMALVFAVRGRHLLSAACWGIALSTKMNAYMLIMPALLLPALGILRLPSGRRAPYAGWFALLAAVPAVPWMLRTYLDHGTPFWPIMNGIFHGTPWEPDAVTALAQYRTGPAHIAASLETFLPAWLADNRILLWALPLAWLGSGRVHAEVRSMARTAVLVFLFMFAVIHMEYARYTLPVLVLLCFACAPAVAWLVAGERGPVRWFAWLVVVVLAWSPVGAVLRDGGLTVRRIAGFVTGTTSHGQWLGHLLTTRLTAQRAVRALGGVRGLMLVDEVYAFRWPGRVLTDGMPGRALPWALTRDAGSPGRLRIRFRQLRVSHVVLNFVSEGHSYNANVYAWDERQLALWHDFVGTYMQRVELDLPSDVPNGGFCIWRLVPAGSVPPGPLFYLPGIKPLRAWIRGPYAASGDMRESATRALAVSARFPDVLVFKADAGIFLAGAGEFAGAHALLSECASRGMVGEALHIYLGLSAMRLGKVDEAIGHLRIAERFYPGDRAEVGRRMGEALARKALLAGRAGRPVEALSLAIEGVAHAPREPFALMTLADVRAARGELAEALDAYLGVAALDGIPDAIRSRADKMIRECRERLRR